MSDSDRDAIAREALLGFSDWLAQTHAQHPGIPGTHVPLVQANIQRYITDHHPEETRMDTTSEPGTNGAEPIDLLRPELRGLARELLAADFTVKIRPGRNERIVSWMIIEKHGNTGRIQYEPNEGYKVIFSLKPSRENGSGLLVTIDGEPPQELPELLRAAEVAVTDCYANFATSRPLLNRGVETSHRDQILTLT